jgi:hypothetical protein
VSLAVVCFVAGLLFIALSGPAARRGKGQPDTKYNAMGDPRLFYGKPEAQAKFTRGAMVVVGLLIIGLGIAAAVAPSSS